ncbi:MAG: holdfast anchoring protein HfaB [Brevundimonas sp.]|uniref:holdfast anchoring protein HfaB n=1 Tax=Brevundimonas sp. TaxID=1871086 RepID=UPI002735B8A8|nr:holdfast anchoring protein HfaB [Brevundimonas sp.]MDP3404306.1 holdfast anchoring protein HfaB [Brevundimonas sp.]
MSPRLMLPLVLGTLALVAGPAGADPRGGAPVTANPSSYSPALRCLAARAGWWDGGAPRVAVGRIADMTGRNEFYTGTPVPQGASLFAITALRQAGVPVVERLDNTVAEIELNYARQHLLSDTPEQAGQSADNFRPILAGQIAGSRYYIVGGVTELNYNIASSGLQLQGGQAANDDNNALGGAIGRSHFVLNVAVDLRLVDTRSQEVVETVTFQKQVVGTEAGLNVRGVNLRGSDDTATGRLNGGTGAMEPIQFAVRSLVERGVFELVAGLQSGDARGACLPSGPGAPA